MPTCSRASRPMSCSVTKAPTSRVVTSPGGRRSDHPGPSSFSSAAPPALANRPWPPSCRTPRYHQGDPHRHGARGDAHLHAGHAGTRVAFSSFEVGGGAGQLIDGFLRQSRSVAAGIDGLVGRMIAEHKDSIVEGSTSYRDARRGHAPPVPARRRPWSRCCSPLEMPGASGALHRAPGERARTAP